MKLTQASTAPKRRTTRTTDRLTLDLMTRLQTAQVAGRMRDARIEAGLTQEQMAELVGVHKRVIENIENNRLVKGPYQYVNAWSDITNWTVQQLLHGDARTQGEDAAVLEALQENSRRLDALEDLAGRLEGGLAEIRALLLPAQSGN